MVKINRIYTRTGDDGSTGLVGGERISKAALRVDAYGDVDELNSWLGSIVSILSEPLKAELLPKLSVIQNELFDIGSELAAPKSFDLTTLPVIQAQQVTRLEEWIDALSGTLPELKSFVLPGGSPITAQIHIARTVCRRAERLTIRLHNTEPVRSEVLHYLNRLSDLLFSMARYSCHVLQQEEVLWQPAKTRG
jgi:cob(I)alamin adenosyltransferase